MSASSLLLALHSSSESLGVGLCDLRAREATPQCASFPLGRQLSNDLLPCVEQLLPAERWPQLARISVATGPGGFTGTRLTVVLARTLAQQLQIPLHGFGSFLLMARRLAEAGVLTGDQPRFWLHQTLPRRGTVAGAYCLDAAALGGIRETDEPRLFRPEEEWPGSAGSGEPGAPAEVDAEQDVLQLLALGHLAHAAALPGPWETVLPLYPTSPVDGA